MARNGDVSALGEARELVRTVRDTAAALPALRIEAAANREAARRLVADSQAPNVQTLNRPGASPRFTRSADPRIGVLPRSQPGRGHAPGLLRLTRADRRTARGRRRSRHAGRRHHRGRRRRRPERRLPWPACRLRRPAGRRLRPGHLPVPHGGPQRWSELPDRSRVDRRRHVDQRESGAEQDPPWVHRTRDPGQHRRSSPQSTKRAVEPHDHESSGLHV